MSATLSTVPLEILSEILENIEQSRSYLDLALTCRHLYNAALPSLYKDVALRYRDEEESYPHLSSFTMHIATHPELAAQVQSFTLHEQCGREEEDLCPGVYALGNIPDELKAKAHVLSRTKREAREWIEALKGGYDDDAFLTILLPSLPNLQRMQVVVPTHYGYFTNMLHRTISRSQKRFPRQPPFPSLRILIADCDLDQGGLLPRLVSSTLRLPTLQKLYCRKIGSYGDETDYSLTRLKKGSSKLTHFELRDSKLNRRDLVNLLRSFSCIKTFVYELGWGYNNTTVCRYSTRDLDRSLHYLEDTLENLWLDTNPGPFYWCDTDNFDTLLPIHTLANFKVLKHLKVGMFILFGDDYLFYDGASLDNTEEHYTETDGVSLAEILPYSLETIYVAHTNGRVRGLTRAFARLLRRKESAVPNLKRIAYEAYITGNDHIFNFSTLDQLGKDTGVVVDRIDGTALPGDDDFEWTYTPGAQDRGQGMDGSVTWAAEFAGAGPGKPRRYINVGI